MRNEHPLLSCIIAHPLHPFDRTTHLKFLSVVLLFGIFSSVITIHDVCTVIYRRHPPDSTATHQRTAKMALLLLLAGSACRRLLAF
eukprot:SAG11_NODE_37_length_21777_cov_4.523711_3_plen_86_part_00